MSRKRLVAGTGPDKTQLSLQITVMCNKQNRKKTMYLIPSALALCFSTFSFRIPILRDASVASAFKDFTFSDIRVVLE